MSLSVDNSEYTLSTNADLLFETEIVIVTSARTIKDTTVSKIT